MQLYLIGRKNKIGDAENSLASTSIKLLYLIGILSIACKVVTTLYNLKHSIELFLVIL